MTAASQLELCFDFEPLPVQRKHQPIDRRRSHRLGEPYHPFDADLARSIILEQLRKAGGEWVGKRRIFRACGMHSTYVATLVSRMEDEGAVEIGEKFWPRDQYRITTSRRESK